MKAIIRNGVPEPIFRAFADETGVSHPGNVLTLWSDDQLAAIGVYPVVDASVQEGHVVTGSSLTFDGKTVTRVFTSVPAPPPTLDEYRSAIQSHVEEAARSRDYDGALSLASYVASTDPQWAAEAQAFVGWRDAVWAKAYVLLDGHAPEAAPSVADVLAALPAITWPD